MELSKRDTTRRDNLRKKMNDYISISKGHRDDHRQITTNSKFFVADEYIIVEVNDNKIKFIKPDIDYLGKAYKIKSRHSNWVGFTIVADLPMGKFQCDKDETNEDEMVIYYY